MIAIYVRLYLADMMKIEDMPLSVQDAVKKELGI